MECPENLSEISIHELLQLWPQAAYVFIRHKMACIGCSLSAFDTVHDVAFNYQLQPEQLIFELQNTINFPET